MINDLVKSGFLVLFVFECQVAEADLFNCGDAVTIRYYGRRAARPNDDPELSVFSSSRSPSAIGNHLIRIYDRSDLGVCVVSKCDLIRTELDMLVNSGGYRGSL